MDQITLTVVRGPVAGRQISVDPPGELVVGRGRQADFTVMDPRMSRRHFAIYSTTSQWRLRDAGSSNGTLVNDRRVAEAAIVDGDLIVAGDTTFCVTFRDRFSCLDEPPAHIQSCDEDDSCNKRTWIAFSSPAS